jgi:hypothetical protein
LEQSAFRCPRRRTSTTLFIWHGLRQDHVKIDAKAAHALKAGGYHFLEGKQHHYAFTKSETIIQVSGNGPFDITYIDPADDPTKAH